MWGGCDVITKNKHIQQPPLTKSENHPPTRLEKNQINAFVKDESWKDGNIRHSYSEDNHYYVMVANKGIILIFLNDVQTPPVRKAAV